MKRIIKFRGRTCGFFTIMLRIDIAILVLMLCANFIMTGNPFWMICNE